MASYIKERKICSGSIRQGWLFSLKLSQLKAMFAKGQREKFVVGVGNVYNKGNRVHMDIQGKPIGNFDRGTVVSYPKEEYPYWWNVKNDRTGKVELFHSNNLLPDKSPKELMKAKKFRLDHE